MRFAIHFSSQRRREIGTDPSDLLVAVPVVDVGIMHVRVNELGVLVPVAVRYWIGSDRVKRAVRMLVVRVMYVRMIVGRRVVRVLVHMTLRHVKPDPHSH